MRIEQEFHKELLRVLSASKLPLQLVETSPNSSKENEEMISRLEEVQRKLIMLNLNQD
jgi:hypothetical protein